MQRIIRYLAAGSALAAGTLGAVTWVAVERAVQRRKPDPYANPGTYDLPFEPVSFPSRDGLTLRGWWIPQVEAKSTIVFCPGALGSVHSDLEYAPWLHEAGYNLLLFDWRGRGRSDGAVASLGALERRDLLGAIDWLKTRDIRRIGLLGFSMGGAVAISTAPVTDVVGAVVADGTFARVSEVLENGIAQEYPPLVARILGRLMIPGMSLRLRTDVTLVDPIRWAAFLRAPLLLIHGEKDPYVSTESVHQLFQAAREPKELWLVPEAGHREVYKLRPQEYRERVVGFFDRWLA
jgi:fermentation-respiration switch protein FrsA (DUF1100 family)